MDSIKRPFLFFYVSVVLFFMAINETCHAQEYTDSLSYYYNAILTPKKSTDLHHGIKYYTKQKEHNLIYHDTLKAINNLRMIAIAQFKTGFNYESENTIVEALLLINNLKQKDTLIYSKIGLFNQLGRIYRRLLNFEKAIDTYKKAINIATRTSDSIAILNNIANIYKDTEEYKLAINIYSEVYKKSIKSGNKLQLAMALNNLGYVQSKINSPEALNNINKALNIRLKENNLTGIYASYKSLTHYYWDRNKKEKALSYANKGYEVVKKINSSSYTEDALSLFMHLTTDPKVAAYKRLTDSLSQAKQLAENKNAFIKYNVAEEQKKSALSNIEKEKEKGLKLFYMAIAASVFLLLIASYFIFRYRYKKGTLEQVYKTETRISQKVHDEVANDLYNVMTQLQNKPNNNIEALDVLERIYTKTRDISKESGALDLKGDFNEILSDLLLSYKSPTLNVLTKNPSKINWTNLSDIKKTAIYRVLQELMTNMKKHSKASFVVLTFSQINNKIIIHYKDNGVGCSVVKNSGLQNAENRIKSIQGTIIFESRFNNGFKAKITI